MQSLYGACSKITDSGLSGTENIGGYDIFIERFTQSDLLTDGYSLGNTNQENVVLVTDSVIQIPEGQTLTCASPKKSLVIMCDTLINNGTISMQAKGPNILPHDYLLLGDDDGFNDILIPAYGTTPPRTHTNNVGFGFYGSKGVNGSNRQCGCGGYGGFGCRYGGSSSYSGIPGAGTAFAGGGGSGGVYIYGWNTIHNYTPPAVTNANSTYPMRGGDVYIDTGGYNYEGGGGVGNPPGRNQYQGGYATVQRTGVGGRIVVFCNKLINNGTITVNGTDANASAARYQMVVAGGASGAGAVDIFYNTFNNSNKDEGTITATGGKGANGTVYGGDGSITLTPMNLPSMIKPGFLGTKGSTRLVELIKNKFEEVEDKIQDATGQITFDYQSTNTIELAKDEDTKVITANTKISQENENGLYALDDGLYVKFTSFTDEEINLIYNQIQSVSYNTNFTTHDLFAILTKDGYVFKAKE